MTSILLDTCYLKHQYNHVVVLDLKFSNHLGAYQFVYEYFEICYSLISGKLKEIRFQSFCIFIFGGKAY